jgi:hypothetical protein
MLHTISFNVAVAWSQSSSMASSAASASTDDRTASSLTWGKMNTNTSDAAGGPNQTQLPSAALTLDVAIC